MKKYVRKISGVRQFNEVADDLIVEVVHLVPCNTLTLVLFLLLAQHKLCWEIEENIDNRTFFALIFGANSLKSQKNHRGNQPAIW